MITRTKERAGEPAATTLHMTCLHGDALYYSGVLDDIPYLYSGKVTDYFGEQTPNSTGSRRDWKDYEEYYISRGKRSSGLSALRTYAQVWEFYPHTYYVDCSEALFGYFGYPALPGNLPRYAWGDPGRPTVGLPKFHEKRLDNGFVPAPSNLDELQQKALASMLPSIKAELSSINSIIELKDFVSLPHLIKDLAKFTFLRNGNKTLRQISRLSADGFLQWKFNIRPLISDISGVFSALSSIERRINDLITRVGRVQRRKYSYQWNEFSNSKETSSGHYIFPQFQLPNNMELTAFYTTREAIHAPSLFNAEIEYNFNFTQYQIEHARLLGLLDAFGVNLNPAIIWNAIPWSFVIDWVFGVSRFLDQFKVENMEPKINIRRYCWSVKRARQIWLTKGSYTAPLDGHSLPGGNSTGVLMPVVNETSYRRKVDLPSISSIISSGINSSEFTLGAALVIARRKRHKS